MSWPPKLAQICGNAINQVSAELDAFLLTLSYITGYTAIMHATQEEEEMPEA